MIDPQTTASPASLAQRPAPPPRRPSTRASVRQGALDVDDLVERVSWLMLCAPAIEPCQTQKTGAG